MNKVHTSLKEVDIMMPVVLITVYPSFMSAADYCISSPSFCASALIIRRGLISQAGSSRVRKQPQSRGAVLLEIPTGPIDKVVRGAMLPEALFYLDPLS
jgi:hypothetical protein